MVHIKSSLSVSPQTFDLTLRSFDKLKTREDLGFLHLPVRSEVWERSLAAASQLKIKCKHLVVCGMGGSSLGARALVQSLGDASTVSFLLSTDPATVTEFFKDEVKARESHYLIVSKSGGTLEVAVFLALVTENLRRWRMSLSQNITVITEDKPSPLSVWAEKNNIPTIPHPKDVGGRFSVLSEVGLVPAAFSGVDIAELRRGALAVRKSSLVVSELAALYLESFARRETISVLWSYIDAFQMFLPWYNQLWSESLGQKNTLKGGPAPTVSTPFTALGTCDQHSVLQQFMDGARDKFIVFVRAASRLDSGPVLSTSMPGFEYLKGQKLGFVFSTQSQATEEALIKAGVKTASITVEESDGYSMGELLMLYEMVVAVIGEALELNVFEQPGVELGKKITKTKLEISPSL